MNRAAPGAPINAAGISVRVEEAIPNLSSRSGKEMGSTAMSYPEQLDMVLNSRVELLFISTFVFLVTPTGLLLISY